MSASGPSGPLVFSFSREPYCNAPLYSFLVPQMKRSAKYQLNIKKCFYLLEKSRKT